ncbi:YuzD family protein [Oceanobacillus iheyensis]|uniref:YuzD family protein n=1 Tax=Oceanobacillus iheyensis TaxID=182710 RepID=UPI00362820B5
MASEKIMITVYGSKQICASCVGAPGSKDTYEWLQAAIGRKYVVDMVDYTYIDINEPQKELIHQEFINEIIEEDMFYPIIFINDKIVAEGIPTLKPIYRTLDDLGLPLVN